MACDGALKEPETQKIEKQYGDSPAMVSGAGHDTMALAARVPSSMLFVWCRGGISHDPDESVEQLDVATALYMMARFIVDGVDQGKQ